MADTWVAQYSVAFASAKSMLDVFNGASSAKAVKAYRFCIFNTQTGAVTAALTAMQIDRTTAASAGTSVTPVKHNPGAASLDANTNAGSGRTITRSDVFRKFLWLLEEATTTGTTQANWEVLIPVGIIFFPTGGDTNLEPIVCPAGSAYGVEIYNSGAGAVSTMDHEITFTSS